MFIIIEAHQRVRRQPDRLFRRIRSTRNYVHPGRLIIRAPRGPHHPHGRTLKRRPSRTATVKRSWHLVLPMRSLPTRDPKRPRRCSNHYEHAAQHVPAQVVYLGQIRSYDWSSGPSKRRWPYARQSGLTLRLRRADRNRLQIWCIADLALWLRWSNQLRRRLNVISISPVIIGSNSRRNLRDRIRRNDLS